MQSRPVQCFFECRSALMRGVLWSRGPLAFTADGKRIEVWRLFGWTVVSLLVFLLATGAQIYILVVLVPPIECTYNHFESEQDHRYNIGLQQCGAAERFWLFRMCQLQLAMLGFFALSASELLRTHMMATNIMSTGQLGFGSAMMFDM